MNYPNLSPQLDQTLSALVQRLDLNDRHEMLAALEHIAESCGDDHKPVAHLQDPRVPEKARRAIRQLQTENGIPVDRLRPHQQAWTATDKYEAVLDAATATAVFATTSRDLDGLPKYRRELLDNVLWLMTVAPSGKYTTRYRTAAAISQEKPTLRHEHVFTRKTLITELLALPAKPLNPTELQDAIREVLRTRAVACTVTNDEHKLLTTHDQTHSGWQRYEAARITVIDMLTGDPIDTTRSTKP